MSQTFIMLLTFASVALCIVGIASLLFDLFVRDQQRIDKRLREEFGNEISQRAQASPLFRDLRDADRSKPLDHPTLKLRMQTLIDQAGLPWSASHLLIVTGTLPVLIGAAVGLLLHSLLLAVVALVAVSPIPILSVLVIRSRRLNLLCRQLPDAFDVMSRSLKAGQTVPAAFQLIAQDFPSPIADEFAYCYEQQHLGIAQEVALRDLARRTGIMELQIFVVAMIVNSRAGGNLAELLAKLAMLLRKRANIHGRIRALTGEGRMQAAVLIALPFVVFLAMYLLNREYAEVLLGYPWLLAGCGASQTLGAVCIHRIINIEY